METLRKIWELIAPYFSGGVAGALITVIVIPIIKGMLTKTTAKLNIEGIIEKQNAAIDEAVDKAVDKVKTLGFKQSIQPLVESELKKVAENANGYIEGEVGELKASNERIISVLAALGAFFDDSIIPEAKKEAFAAAIKAAQAPVVEQEISVQEVAEETPVKPVTARGKKREVIR